MRRKVLESWVLLICAVHSDRATFPFMWFYLVERHVSVPVLALIDDNPGLHAALLKRCQGAMIERGSVVEHDPVSS